MDKLTEKMHKAARLAASQSREDELRQLDKKLRHAKMQGARQAEQKYEVFHREMTNPIAKYFLDECAVLFAREAFARMDPQDVPYSIVAKCAKQVWNYVEKEGAPIDEEIRFTVNYFMEDNSTRFRVHINEMTLEHRADRRGTKL